MKQDISKLPDNIQRYLSLIQETTVTKALEKQKKSVIDFFQTIDDSKLLYRYAKNKWTIKEILQHIIDFERILCYRALAISRSEKASLPGFDEKAYIEESHANERDWKDLIHEFELLRGATIAFSKGLEKEDLKKEGDTAGYPIALESVLYLIVGHTKHHLGVIKERYLFK